MAAAATIAALLTAATPRLAAGGSGRLDAELLLAHVLAGNRATLYAAPERTLAATQVHAFEALVARRAAGCPLAYLVGRAEFWSLDLVVDERVLVPRPETELLVECVLGVLPPGSVTRLADLGTGSGAIACALAQERPRATIFASDRSLSALEMARRNVARHGAGRVQVLAGDWLAPFGTATLDVVVANPPYVAMAESHLMNAATAFEPRAALFAAGDGLADLAAIIADGRRVLRPGGWLLVEHGLAQGAAVRALLGEHGYGAIATHRDLAGHERVSLGRG
ncbi:MAG: peptide chain release factor N(5)-glutamine methyltransferase [Gammaproteobacteria bacterium]